MYSNACALKRMRTQTRGGRRRERRTPLRRPRKVCAPSQCDTDRRQRTLRASSLLGFYLREDRLAGAVVVGQGADMIEEFEVLLREQPKVSDRSRLANENVRPAAVFAR